MMLPPFRLHRPRTLAEAIDLRVRLGEEAIPYAGGTELLLAMKLGLAPWRHLIDVKLIPELGEIRFQDGVLRIGATATHHRLARDPAVARSLPALARLAEGIGNVRVRVAGTLAGNLAFAEPHADPPALLTALGASVVLAGPRGERRLGVDRFLVGAYQTDLAPDELVAAVEVPIPVPGMRAAYLNFRVLERPSLGVAVVGTVAGGRWRGQPSVVVGAVDRVPRRIPARCLDGAGADDLGALEAIAAAARDAVEPTDDLAGSAAYKRHLVGVLTRRSVLAALEQAGA
jgi:carbon-monoxide dehydrogenase medium subunit